MSPYQSRCCYLNCKSMQVWGEDFRDDPEYQAGMVDFWCNQTFQAIGPDGAAVNLELCSVPERPCFREFPEIAPPPPVSDGPVER